MHNSSAAVSDQAWQFHSEESHLAAGGRSQKRRVNKQQQQQQGTARFELRATPQVIQNPHEGKKPQTVLFTAATLPRQLKTPSRFLWASWV